MDQMRRLAPCCKNGSAEDSSEYTASLRAPLKRNRQSTQQEREGITATGAATQERIFCCLQPLLTMAGPGNNLVQVFAT
jgi:hypothetical protein